MGSSDYKSISKKKFLSALKRMARKIDGFEITKGGKHHKKLEYSFAKRSYPLDLNHPGNDIYDVIQCTVKWLVESGVCTKSEFDEELGIKVKSETMESEATVAVETELVE